MLVLPVFIAVSLYRDLFKFGPNGEVLNGDIAYPTMIINLLPTGLVGVMIAALLAALMGAMSSVFNSASTLVTLDFYKKIKPDATELQLVGFGRVMTGFMVILGLAWVPFIHLISSQLYIYLQSVQAYISPPIAACFILGILWPRLNGTGALSSLLTGFALGAFRFVMELKARASGGAPLASGPVAWLVNMNFLHYAIFMFVVCSAQFFACRTARDAAPVADRQTAWDQRYLYPVSFVPGASGRHTRAQRALSRGRCDVGCSGSV